MSGTCWVLYKREFWAYFNSPIAYVFAVFFLVVTNFVFLFASPFFLNGQAELRGYFGMLPMFFLFFIPAISMRLWSEEQKIGTIEQLMTLPVKTADVVVAKFMAGFTFLAANLALTLSLPITLAIIANPDWGPIFSSYLGALLLGAVFMSVGAFASSLTENQIVAFVISISICFVLYIIGLPGTVTAVSDFSRLLGGVLDLVGVMSHYDNLVRGLVDLRDIVYFISVTAMFLAFNTFGVESRKY